MISTGILASSCAGGKARDLQLVPVCGLFLNLRVAFSPTERKSLFWRLQSRRRNPSRDAGSDFSLAGFA